MNVEIKNENKFFFAKKKDVNLCQFFKVITQVIRLKTSYLKKNYEIQYPTNQMLNDEIK